MTKEEYEIICAVHERESQWYVFLHYGCPLPPDTDPEYTAKFEAVSKALADYDAYLKKQRLKTNSDVELCL